MFRLIKIIFNAFLLVLAIIGFNAIGGQKYVEAVKEILFRSMLLKVRKKSETFQV